MDDDPEKWRPGKAIIYGTAASLIAASAAGLSPGAQCIIARGDVAKVCAERPYLPGHSNLDPPINFATATSSGPPVIDMSKVFFATT